MSLLAMLGLVPVILGAAALMLGIWARHQKEKMKLRAIQVQNGTMTTGPHEFSGISIFAGCFGEDAAGEMYLCDYDNNKILRVDAQ